MENVEDMFVKIFEVGPQGILIDMNHQTTMDMAKFDIENCNYNFEYGKAYVCLPVFIGSNERAHK